MLKTTLVALTALAIMTGSALAAQKTDGEAPAGRAFIPFADMNGSIDNWHGDGRDGIWVEGHNDHWYYAKFMTPCQSLPFATTIGFVTDGTNRIDKFSSILVQDERCWFKTFDKSDGPPKADKD
jgi:hypothetical protein